MNADVFEVGRVAPRAPNSVEEIFESRARHVTSPAETDGSQGLTCPAEGCVFSCASMNTISAPWRVVSWICRIAAAVILLQTLYFKFTGAEESVYIFTKVGLEPWGRYASGVAELFAALLLLFPRTTWLGAFIAAGVMIGAIGSHLTKLGIVVKGDGGLLFALALIVFVAAVATLFIHRAQIPFLANGFAPASADS